MGYSLFLYGKTMSKRIIKEALVTSHEDTEDFDCEFWFEAGSAAKWDALEQMIDDYYIMRGLDANERKFQRSVDNIIRIKR